MNLRRRASLVVVGLSFGAIFAACASIVGIDALPLPPDGGTDASSSSQDAMTDGTTAMNDGSTAGKTNASDAGTDAAVVDAGPRAKLIAAGGNHICVVSTVGDVYCWGANDRGQVGNANLVVNTEPMKVGGLSKPVTAIAAGTSHTCALNADGMWCWGDNLMAELGPVGGSMSTVPLKVGSLPAVITAISARGKHSCALADGGFMYCWGNDEGHLELGTGATDIGEFESTPGSVATFDGGGVAAIGTGEQTNCAALPTSTDSGTLYCWGGNDTGAVGDGTDGVQGGSFEKLPVPVLKGAAAWPIIPTQVQSSWVSIANDGDFTCALDSTGSVWCWGEFADGELGYPGAGSVNVNPGPPWNYMSTEPSAPAALPGPASRIAVGADSVCAIISDGGTVECWGSNAQGQGGAGVFATQVDAGEVVPAPVPGIKGARDISAGIQFACAVLDTGGVRCWGLNFSQGGGGQLGTGDKTSSTISSPTAVLGFQ
jgi:alpha-tubulin suppressor-like RCC1 family protein